MSEQLGVDHAEVPKYDHYSDVFYLIWGDSPEVMQQAEEANRLINNYLYAFGASHLYELPPSIQGYLLEKARITIELGEDND